MTYSMPIIETENTTAVFETHNKKTHWQFQPDCGQMKTISINVRGFHCDAFFSLQAWYISSRFNNWIVALLFHKINKWSICSPGVPGFPSWPFSPAAPWDPGFPSAPLPPVSPFGPGWPGGPGGPGRPRQWKSKSWELTTS